MDFSLKHKTPFYGSKLLLKVVFDETHSKQPKIHREIHTCLWILNISRNKSANQKSQDFCQMFATFEKKARTFDRKPYPRVWI
jgi:hypothetical protein